MTRGGSAGTVLLRSVVLRCTSTPHSTASTTLAKSTSKPSPRGLDDATAVIHDFRIDKLAAQRFEAFERAFLVRSYL
jgi:hypothetical protein